MQVRLSFLSRTPFSPFPHWVGLSFVKSPWRLSQPLPARLPACIAKSQAADLRLDVYNTPLLALVMDGSHVGIDMALVTFTYLYY